MWCKCKKEDCPQCAQCPKGFLGKMFCKKRCCMMGEKKEEVKQENQPQTNENQM